MLKLKEILNTVVCGEALSVLKTIPDNSVNCVVTSPPYWGLRDYGIQPVVWDGDKDCKHIWGNKTTTLKHKSGETNPGKESWFKDGGGLMIKAIVFVLNAVPGVALLGLSQPLNYI